MGTCYSRTSLEESRQHIKAAIVSALGKSPKNYDASGPPKPAVPEGKVRICAAMHWTTEHGGRAQIFIDAVAARLPDKYETWYHYEEHRPTFKAYCAARGAEMGATKEHRTSPFVWLEMPDGTTKIIGGRDDTVDWIATLPELADDGHIQALTAKYPNVWDALSMHHRPGTAIKAAPPKRVNRI